MTKTHPIQEDKRWLNVGHIPARSYICGYCGEGVGPDNGYETTLVADSSIYVASANNRRILMATSKFLVQYTEPKSATYPGKSSNSMTRPEIA